MATTTTNFGWDIPQSTDLVKDGATAIAALGQDIDTALVDLKGGTTGQVLAKATNTDLDFTWVAQDDSNAIQNAIVDAKGDLISATAADTPARLAVGTNGQVLTADSTTATGIKWATPASSNQILQIVQGTTGTSTSSSSSTYADTTLTATITPSSVNSKILIFVSQVGLRKTLSASSVMDLQLLRGSTVLVKFSDYAGSNGSTAENYGWTANANWYDSPATTSATTYKTQFRSALNTAAVAVQANGGTSTIVLMEIAGL